MFVILEESDNYDMILRAIFPSKVEAIERATLEASTSVYWRKYVIEEHAYGIWDQDQIVATIKGSNAKGVEVTT